MSYIGIIASFFIAFFIGFRTKRFVFLFLDIFLGLGLGILSVYLYLIITPPVKVGLGIIALAPAMFILFSVLGTIVAIIGGVIGTLAGRRRK